MSKLIGHSAALARMRKGDVLERFEVYPRFRSDGARVRPISVRILIDLGKIKDAKPNIGAPYELIVDKEAPAKKAALAQINKDRVGAGMKPVNHISKMWWSMYGAEWIAKIKN